MPRTGSTPSERSLYGQIGGYTRAAMYDSREMTANARRTFNERFEREVDPNHELPEPERAKRAEAARKAYFLQLARRSAMARKKRKELARELAELAEAGVDVGEHGGGDAA